MRTRSRSRHPPARERASSRHDETNVNINIDADLGRNPDRSIGRPLPPPVTQNREMWTEVTTDLVSKEAMRACGYEWEETSYGYMILNNLTFVSLPHYQLSFESSVFVYERC